ncbi:MAG: bifunctional oligoribonuclease/PAP phosphatase NrnA [Ruminococcaceae bacterium]|nr:bifunctional oligoribonuclease/PAP phosphatase NrnA [Oscillospiraceae bacterium]
MNFEAKKLILDKIKEYDKIIIFRHKRPDGDAVGSTKGMREILRLTFPEKDIRLINCDYSDYVSFLGDEDGAVEDSFYTDALALILDTATSDRISNQKYTLCREKIKFDHHINLEHYGDYEWVEEERSSVCEMVADFYRTFSDELKINKEAATYIYAGMVTDSGRFRFRSVSGETLRLAGMLLDMGVDLDTLHAHLYMKEFHTLKFQAYVYEKMQISENGVAYLHVTKEMQDAFSLSSEEASASVSYMESIKNSLIWIAFIDNDDGSIRVRLRSRFVTVNSIAEKYNGGGHACACGATVYTTDEMMALISDADVLLKDYKENNEGWL